MKYKNWSDEIWKRLTTALDEELRTNPRPIAAFDADGTLWDTDLGESFFKYQIANSKLPGLPTDPWRHYRDWKESGDPRPAYLWLAQINAGQKIAQVKSWARESVAQSSPLPVFHEQKKWIEHMLSRGVEVYVVTASIKWAVEPGAARLGLPEDRVIGIRTRVMDGIVGSEQEGPISYREGKVEALLHATGGRLPFFSSGNTMGDFALLGAATRLAMAVGAAPEGHELWKTEDELRSHAAEKGWLAHRF